MSLPAIKNKILDFAMGVQGAQADGRFAAIGVAAKPSNGILTFNAPDQVEPMIGDGPLRDLLVSALSIARTPVSVIALEGSIKGHVSDVLPSPNNTGTGKIDTTGSPRNDYHVIAAIEKAGGLNEAVFRLTIDGLPGKQITVPDGAGRYEIPGTGIILVFTPGNDGFAEGDLFAFSTTAPQATNGDILAAADKIIAANLSIEFVAVAGIASAPLYAALAMKAEEAEKLYQYLFFVVQARYANNGETLDEWKNALCGIERGNTASVRLQVCAGWIEEADANGQVDTRGIIGVYCGTVAARKVQEGPDAVKFGAIAAAVALKPDGLNDGQIEDLLNAGYVTVRKFVGRKGIYFTSGQMTSEEGSDFDVVERRRVMDKACRNLYQVQLSQLNDAVKLGRDGTPEGIDMFLALSQQPLDTMKTNREISDGYVYIPPGQNLLSDHTLRTKVRIVPLGKMKFIENEIAYTNPALTGKGE
jgi:hypothetical protein